MCVACVQKLLIWRQTSSHC